MKKLLTILILLLAVASQSWATTKVETILWESTYDGGITLGHDVVSTLSEGDILNVYMTVTENASLSFMYKYHKTDDDTWPQVAFSGIAGEYPMFPWQTAGTTVFSYTLTSEDITGLNQYDSSIICIYQDNANKISISKVTITREKPIDFSNLVAGDLIRIIHSAGDGSKTLSVKTGETSLYNVSPADDATTTEFAIEAGNVDAIKTNGIQVESALTVSEIQSESPANSTIWRYSSSSFNTKTVTTTNFANLNNIAIGNRIKISTNKGNDVSLTATFNNGSDINVCEINDWDGSKEIEVSSANIEHIKSNGLSLTGANIDYTTIELVTWENSGTISANNFTRLWSSTADSGNPKQVIFSETYGVAGWEIGDTKYNEATSITVNLAETPSQTIKMVLEYANLNGKVLESETTFSGTSASINVPQSDLLKLRCLYLKSPNATTTITLGSVRILTPALIDAETCVYEVSNSIFSSAAVGNKIRITYENISEGAMTLQVGTTDGGTDLLASTTVTGTTQEIDITAGNLSDVTTNGLYLRGSNIRITNVEVVSLGTLLNVSGGNKAYNQDLESWNDNLTFANTNFATAKAGDVITVQLSSVNETAELALQANWANLNVNAGGSVAGQTQFHFTLTKSSAILLQDYGLIVKGYGFKVSGVYFNAQAGDAASISTLTSFDDFDGMDASFTSSTLAAGKNIQLYAGSNSNINAQDKKLVVTTTSAAKLTVAVYLVDVNDPLTDEVTSEGTAKTEYSVSLGSENRKIQKIVITNNDEAAVTFSSISLADDEIANEQDLYNPETKPDVTTTSGVTVAEYWKFGNAVVGDKIIVYGSDISSATIALKGAGANGVDSGENPFNWTEFSSGSFTDSKYSCTLTADALLNLKANGLFIIASAGSFKINKVTLVSETAIPESEPVTNYTLTKTVTPEGSGTILVQTVVGEEATDAEETSFASGTNLKLTATPAANYAFSKWTVGGTDYDTDPYEFTITEAVTATATFVPSITTSSFSEMGTDQYTGNVLSASGGIQDYIGAESTISGTRFNVTTSAASKLSVQVYYVGDISGPSVYETITTDADAKKSYELKLDKTKMIEKIQIYNQSDSDVTFSSISLGQDDDATGTITTDDMPIGWSSTYTPGTKTVAFEGAADSWPARGWNVGGTTYNGKTITVTFASEPALENGVITLKMEYYDAHGALKTANNVNIGNTIELEVPAGTQAVKRAYLTVASTGTFVLSEITATTIVKYTLTKNATNGAIRVVKSNGDETTDSEIKEGEVLKLWAIGDDGYDFVEWTVGGSTSTTNPYTLTMDAAKEVTATFTAAPTDPSALWSGSKAINWNTVEIAASNFASANTGDKIIINVSYVGDVEWPQVALRKNASDAMSGTENTQLTSSMTSVTYYINESMLADLKQYGLFVSGAGYRLKSVKLEAGDGGDYSKSVWIGNTVLPSDWSGYQQIAASCFTSALADQILRIKVKDLKTSPTISLCQNVDGWPALYEGSTGVALSGGYFQTPITSDMLSKLQANGLIIAGCSFTITSVDILNAGDIKPLTLAVDVENNWIFSSAPTITIKVTNPYNEEMTANAELQVTTDKLDAYTTLTQSVSIDANGSKNIALTFPSTPPAGFYKATALVNGDLARSFYFGVNPTQIVSAPDKQNDFDSYWAAAKQQLDAVVASDNPVLTEVTEKSTSNRKVYLVEFKSIPDGTSGDPVTIRGYYCEPTDGGKHPVLMHYQGYDSFTYGPGGTAPEVYCPSGDDNPDYAEFVLSTRGQALNNREPYVSNGGNPYGQDGWFKANFGNKDSYYYRGAYMDVVRAIEFMATRSTSDMDNLFAEGQSQGGAFTYAAAALSGRTFKAIAPAITFMGDFPDYFELASWPGNEAKEKQSELGWTDTQLYNFLSYFDTKNLATKVSCPVITSIGVQDNICPPHTNIAPYNNVTTASDKKQIVYNAELQHATNSDWNTTYMAFFENYKTALPDNRTEKTINETSTTISADPEQGLTISKVKFTNASSGDIIKVYVSNVASGATITMKEAGGDWSQLTSGSVSGDNYSYKLSAADVAKVKANGLHIMGNGFTSTKVTLKTEGEIPSDEEDPQPSQTGVNISLDDLNEGWSSSYNAATKTITTEGEWAARGWYIGDNRYNSKGSVTVKFEAVNFGVTLKMEYTNTGGESKSVSAGAAAGETGVELDIPADIKTMDKVYITYQPIGTLKLTEATVNDKVVDNRTERTLVEKSQAISDGDIAINRGLFSNAVAGDVLRIYADGLSESSKLALEPGDYSGAFDGANWTGFTESPFKLKLTATLIATIKEKGLLIRGESFTFKKAVLYTEKELGSEISDEEKKGDEEKDDDETIIDKKTGEADLTVLSAQDDTKTTLTENEDGSITMTTTEPYCAAQIWFNDPEPVAGNVLKVELAESKVNVTITVQYTDGTQSQMSANTSGVATARAATRGDSDPGTTIEVPLETGKEVQNIEVKNNVAGTITIKKMQVTTINIFTNGVANLSMLKPQSNATYDTSTHTLATTKGWTGATISPVGGENVSGKELLIEFADASKVKVAVKYRTDVEGPSTIMEKAAKAVRLALDNTKNIQEISIQPTEASIVTFKKIAVNSEESDDGTLKPGKTITLWESAAGEALAWNEVAKQDASVGEMLQEYDELLITISGVTEGCDWPKVFIRDASSEQAGNEVLLNDIGSFPYTVRIVLTGEMAQQLQKGFSICGDGVTVTKLQVYRPEAPKTGDIHLADLNYGYNSSYDKGTHTITTTARWAARGWEIGDKRYNDKNLITVKFEPVDFPVTLKMEYTTGLQTAQATSVGVPAGRTELLLEIPSGISKLDRVYIIYENPGSVKLTEASVTYQDKLKLSTAIEAFEAEGVIHDGRYDTDGWYNLRGMRIAEPKTSGIYIHGGKKVVIY